MKAIFTGTYGSALTPCNVFYYNGWYCVEGSQNVNRTYEELNDGVDVEELQDYDCFYHNEPINSLDALINAVES